MGSEPFVVIVCGDRNWTNRGRIRGVLWRLYAKHPDAVVRHGANGYDEDGRPSFETGKPTVRGADMLAHEEAQRIGLVVDPHPADWRTHGKAAGPIRNQAMLDAEPRPALVLAFHDRLESSRGTGDMWRRATRAAIPAHPLSSRVTPNRIRSPGDDVRDEKSAEPHEGRPRSRIEAVVGTWEREWQEAWIERAGILLDSGADAAVADQTAFLWVSKQMRAAREREAA